MIDHHDERGGADPAQPPLVTLWHYFWLRRTHVQWNQPLALMESPKKPDSAEKRCQIGKLGLEWLL